MSPEGHPWEGRWPHGMLATPVPLVSRLRAQDDSAEPARGGAAPLGLPHGGPREAGVLGRGQNPPLGPTPPVFATSETCLFSVHSATAGPWQTDRSVANHHKENAL